MNICYYPLKKLYTIKFGTWTWLILSIVILIFAFQVFNYIKSKQKLEKFQDQFNSIPIVPTLFSLDDSNVIVDYTRELPQFSNLEKRKDSRSETRASVKLAKEMISQKRPERANKIFLHALALDSNNPDLLTAYGEFLEAFSKDVISAEYHYCKALRHNPAHTKALANRRRTQPLVELIDQSYFSRLDLKRDALRRVPEGHPGLRRMIAENYFRHIYHSNAMEGNTFTLSQTRSFVENRIVISGKSIIEHQEILGMEAALHFINQSLPKPLGNLKVKDILDIHKRVLGFVDPIGSGIFRKSQVFIGQHVPPPAEELEALMDGFVSWLNSDPFLELHPIEMAALAHYKLVFIHPFYDGNGRTGRLLMNLILMMAGYPPIIIPIDKKQEYYQHLETANAGDVRPFIRLIAACAEQTLDEYLWSTIGKIDSSNKIQNLAKSYDISKIFNHDFLYKIWPNNDSNDKIYDDKLDDKKLVDDDENNLSFSDNELTDNDDYNSLNYDDNLEDDADNVQDDNLIDDTNYLIKIKKKKKISNSLSIPIDNNLFSNNQHNKCPIKNDDNECKQTDNLMCQDKDNHLNEIYKNLKVCDDNNIINIDDNSATPLHEILRYKDVIHINVDNEEDQDYVNNKDNGNNGKSENHRNIGNKRKNIDNVNNRNNEDSLNKRIINDNSNHDNNRNNGNYRKNAEINKSDFFYDRT